MKSGNLQQLHKIQVITLFCLECGCQPPLMFSLTSPAETGFIYATRWAERRSEMWHHAGKRPGWMVSIIVPLLRRG